METSITRLESPGLTTYTIEVPFQRDTRWFAEFQPLQSDHPAYRFTVRNLNPEEDMYVSVKHLAEAFECQSAAMYDALVDFTTTHPDALVLIKDPKTRRVCEGHYEFLRTFEFSLAEDFHVIAFVESPKGLGCVTFEPRITQQYSAFVILRANTELGRSWSERGASDEGLRAWFARKVDSLIGQIP